MLDTFDIDSDSVFITGTKIIKDPKQFNEAEQKSFNASKREEIDFLFK